MKKLKKRKKYKTKVVTTTITLVIFFTTLFFIIYIKKANKEIIRVANIKIEEYMQSFLSNNIGYELLKKEELDGIININKNNQGEILYVDYKLDKAYYVLDIVTKKLDTLISELENGNSTIKSKDIVNCNNVIALKLPLFIANSNIFLSNLGPKVYIPIRFVGKLLTNIKTSIVPYGLNNALVEMYITIEITTNIIAPVGNNNEKIKYDVLISSNVINGRVPEIYGGRIDAKSNNLSIPIS